MSEPDEIDRIIAEAIFEAMDMNVSYETAALRLRERLEAAGYVIVRSDRALLARGEENVAGAKTHD